MCTSPKYYKTIFSYYANDFIHVLVFVVPSFSPLSFSPWLLFYTEFYTSLDLETVVTSILLINSSGVGAETTIFLHEGFMNPSSTPFSNNASKLL